MEKRVVLAAVLSAVFLSWYAHAMSKWTGRSPGAGRPIPPTPTATAISDRPEATMDLLLEEEVLTVESDQLAVEFGKQSADIRRVLVKQYPAKDGRPVQFGGQTFPVLRVQSPHEPVSWVLSESRQNAVQFDGTSNGVKKYYLLYELSSDNPLIHIILRSKLSPDEPELIFTASWNKADLLDNKSNPLEYIVLSKNGAGKKSYRRVLGQLRSEKHVPRGTTLSLAERYFCFSLKPDSGTLDVTLLPAKNSSISATVASHQDAAEQRFTAYLGPRDYFKLRDAQFEEAIPVGSLGKLGLVLLSFLSFLASLTKNYGLAIMLFSVLITAATGPFTLMSVKSMKKMQQLKPKIDRIMAQHKGDAAKANQEVFALYKEHRVSPLSGCLPMLLQMPIFIALFQAISHYIELRGASFLWIEDLSLPDRLAVLPFSIPILGNELNILPVLMAVTMFLQTKLSQAGVPTDTSNPTAKLMGGPFMAILFGVMFYHMQSGLVLYWFTNSLMSILLYRLGVLVRRI